MDQHTEKGFVGCFSPGDGAAKHFEELGCVVDSNGWILQLKNADASYYEWDNGFTLISGRGFHNDKKVSKKISAESVALGYQERGELVADSFEGSFTVVIWDAARNKLLLWRDAAGDRLLYYYQAPDKSFWFASSLQLLMHYLGRRPISKLGLTEYLRFLDISPPYTIYQDVMFLPSEKLLRLEPGRAVETVDKPSLPALTFEKYTDFNEVVTVFDGLLKTFVAKQVESAPRLSSFLSGGIDSSLVSAVAATVRSDVRAVTVGFEDARLDESPLARKIAKHLGIAHEVMCFSQEEDLQAFELFTATAGSPFADPAIIPTFQCFKKTAATCDMVLDGTGADTLIGMMPARHLRFILNYSARLPDSIRSMVSSGLAMTSAGRRYKDLFDFEDPVELMIRWKGWKKSEISRLCGAPCDLSHTMFYRIYREGVDTKTPYELYSMLMGNLPDDRIHQSREVFGPEVVFPFFDREIRGFVRSLPMEYRYAPDEPKKLFRHLLGRYVPQEIWDVPKHGFDYPFDKLMRYRDNYLITRYLSSESLAQHGLFDTEMVTRYVQGFLAGDLSLRFKVWALVVFQAWYENSYLQQRDGLDL
jgi:asparagine synthase (glutamine-hydrolysing)